MKNTILNKVDLDLKNILIEAMAYAVEIYKEFKMEAPFSATHNCYASARWDSINEALTSVFQKNNIPFTILKRGFWDLILFCDKNRNFLFSAMRTERFSEICKNPENNAPKYFDSLVSLNSDLEAKASQTTLIGNIYEANDKYNQLESICKSLPQPNDEKYTHAILLFDVKYDDIVSIKLCVVNNKFNIVEEEDIMQTVFTSRILQDLPITENSDVDDAGFSTRKGLVKLKDSAIEAV